MFLRDKNNRPVGCVAYSFSNDRMLLSYGVSVHNPVDSFERSLSRQIALGRLVERPYRLQVSRNLKGHDTVRLIMMDILNNPNMPNRSKKAASNWLVKTQKLSEVKSISNSEEVEVEVDFMEELPE